MTSIVSSRRVWLWAALALGALGAATVLAFGAAAPGADHASGAPADDKRTVLVVGNNWSGNVDVINPRTFKRIDRLNLAKDYEDCVNSTPPGQEPACTVNNEFASEGHPQLVDDVRVAPNGRRLYVSRPSLGDVAAFSIAREKLLWRVDVSGERTDHMALRPDGRELIVSSTVDNRINVIDTRTHQIVDNIVTGDFPHENEYSEDGELIYNGTIGRVIAPDDPELDAGKGLRNFTVADAETHDVLKQVTIGNPPLGRGIRPFHVTPNGRIMYVQMSFYHGFWEYDLERERILRKKELPKNEKSRGLPREDYPLDSAHHGIALNGAHTKICAAGTVSDYVALVRRSNLRTIRIIDVGGKPYWATTSASGRYCYVSNSDTDDVSVIDFRTAREVERFEVGNHPQRMRIVGIDADVID